MTCHVSLYQNFSPKMDWQKDFPGFSVEKFVDWGRESFEKRGEMKAIQQDFLQILEESFKIPTVRYICVSQYSPIDQGSFPVYSLRVTSPGVACQNLYSKEEELPFVSWNDRILVGWKSSIGVHSGLRLLSQEEAKKYSRLIHVFMNSVYAVTCIQGREPSGHSFEILLQKKECLRSFREMHTEPPPVEHSYRDPDIQSPIPPCLPEIDL